MLILLPTKHITVGEMNNSKDVFLDDKPENHTGYLIWQVTSIRQKIINITLKELELTYPQFIIISGVHWLNQSVDKVNQVRLIQFTNMDKSVVSSVLKSLEKRTIVLRDIDPDDTRAKTLKLSNFGISKLEFALPLIKKIDDVFFDRNKNDIEGLNQTLQSLIKENFK
jgi:DNA-binding MarR family transcriptional regulator